MNISKKSLNINRFIITLVLSFWSLQLFAQDTLKRANYFFSIGSGVNCMLPGKMATEDNGNNYGFINSKVSISSALFSTFSKRMSKKISIEVGLQSLNWRIIGETVEKQNYQHQPFFPIIYNEIYHDEIRITGMQFLFLFNYEFYKSKKWTWQGGVGWSPFLIAHTFATRYYVLYDDHNYYQPPNPDMEEGNHGGLSSVTRYSFLVQSTCSYYLAKRIDLFFKLHLNYNNFLFIRYFRFVEYYGTALGIKDPFILTANIGISFKFK